MNVTGLAALSGGLVLLASAASAATFDFSLGRGGFTGGGDGFWSYDGARWVTPGAEFETTSTLDSPGLTVQSDGPVSVTLSHRYDSERPDDFFDGGLFQVEVNGGGFTTVTPDGGYPVAASFDDGCDSLGFAPCWGGDSGGLVTDTLTIEGLSAGDVITLRLLHGTDFSVSTQANDWEIAALSATNAAVPLPATAPLLMLALGGVGLALRRRG